MLKKVMKVMAMPIVVEDECCQTVGHRYRGSSEIEGITLKVQNLEGRKLVLGERAMRGWGPGEIIFRSSQPHYSKVGGRIIEKTMDFPQVVRRQVHIHGSDSVSVVGNEGNRLEREMSAIDGDIDGVRF